MGSPHHDQTLVEEASQNGDDDEEFEDFEILYEEDELEEEPDPRNTFVGDRHTESG